MANKHLKKPDTSPKPEKARHAKAEAPEKPPKAKAKKAPAKKPEAAPAPEQVISLTDTLAAQVEASLNQARTPAPEPEPEPEQPTPKHDAPVKQKPVNFRRDRAKPAPGGTGSAR